jgi:hypothetical protein
LTAINRGQDYCKSSNNIALVPANGTFDLKEILSQASRCLRSIMPVGRKLIIHPLPTGLCTMIISDSHWLLENVMCLVSNAIKYSDSGDVDLHIYLSSNDTRVVEDSTDAAAIAQQSTKSLLVVTIEDHGVGVPKEMRETLFQPFRQAQRMAGGTGDNTISYFLPFTTPSCHFPVTRSSLSSAVNLQDLGCLACQHVSQHWEVYVASKDVAMVIQDLPFGFPSRIGLTKLP